jgi:hypothetical protein
MLLINIYFTGIDDLSLLYQEQSGTECRIIKHVRWYALIITPTIGVTGAVRA